MIIRFIIFTIGTFVGCSGFGLRNGGRVPKPTKVESGPILTVVHPETKTKVFLVGVSHGSEASSCLVTNVLSDKKPSAVVLELCEDRFLTISLNAAVSPQEDPDLMQKYIEMNVGMEERLARHAAKSPLQKLLAIFKFAKDQGFLGGMFVLMGVAVGSAQKLMTGEHDDEFTAAIRAAKNLSIPIRLGDAPQNDTLKSLRNIASLDTINPKLILEGSRGLAFSAFGLCAESSNTASPGCPPAEVLSKSQWLNIPSAYLKNAGLGRSLYPLLLVSLLFLGLEEIPLFSDSSVRASELPWSVASPDYLGLDGGGSGIGIIENIQRVLDYASMLVLVRMTKIIGTDRDAIIADKVLDVCREFPNQEIVVVIGMLHCNGVARWLMSGVPPLPEKRSSSVQ